MCSLYSVIQKKHRITLDILLHIFYRLCTVCIHFTWAHLDYYTAVSQHFDFCAFLLGNLQESQRQFWPFTIPTSLLHAPDLSLCQPLHKGKTLTGGSVVSNPPAVQELRVQSLGQEDPLEKEMATHSSILAQRIPCRGEPGGLQSMGLQRVRYDWATDTFTCFHLNVYPIFLFFLSAIVFRKKHCFWLPH